MKLKTRDDERVFVLLLFVAVLLSLCFRGRMLLLLRSYFLLLHRLKIFHFKGTLTCLISKNCRSNSFTKQREYARVFSLSRTLSLSKRSTTRSSLFEAKGWFISLGRKKENKKKRERYTFKAAAQSSEGNLKFSLLWVTNSFTIHRRDGDTRWGR